MNSQSSDYMLRDSLAEPFAQVNGVAYGTTQPKAGVSQVFTVHS